MKYPVVVHHDKDSAYGVSVPDLPGCFSAGDTFDAALQNVAEAIKLHLEGLEGEGRDIPRASKIEDHLEDKDYAGGVWGFVDIDVTPYLGNTEKINVTLPFSVIRRIDEQAGARGRSRFLAEAALKALEA
ncbi:MAG: type II toxin-antitoxin system HicB family antitoxin [Halioglobus sp.]|nr:type II toxin-antitoxin system HicB family antitoxin [Halioglobus sp.]